MTLRCTDNVEDHAGVEFHTTTWKITNKDILGIINDLSNEEFPAGTHFALCQSYCDEDADLVLFYEDGSYNASDYFLWDPNCDCAVTNGSLKFDSHIDDFTGHYTQEVFTNFYIGQGEDVIVVFCGLGKLKHSLNEKNHKNSESFHLSGSGGYYDEVKDCCWLITGHVTGSGVDNLNDHDKSVTTID